MEQQVPVICACMLPRVGMASKSLDERRLEFIHVKKHPTTRRRGKIGKSTGSAGARRHCLLRSVTDSSVVSYQFGCRMPRSVSIDFCPTQCHRARSRLRWTIRFGAADTLRLRWHLRAKMTGSVIYPCLPTTYR
jgi:hypothetical protein